MSQHLITTTTIQAPCPRCGAPTLVGIAEGLTARVDAQPIANEITALLENKWTYALTRSGELIHRHAGRIRSGLIGESIHAQHQCVHTYPADPP